MTPNCMMCKNYSFNTKRCLLKEHEPFTDGILVDGKKVLMGKKFDDTIMRYVDCNEFVNENRLTIFDFM